MVSLDAYILFILELTRVNSFTSKVFLSKDIHLSSDIIPHNINDMLEFLIKSLFIWELRLE